MVTFVGNAGEGRWVAAGSSNAQTRAISILVRSRACQKDELALPEANRRIRRPEVEGGIPVSTLIFHNPLVKYFTPSAADIEALERELNGAPQAPPRPDAKRLN